MNCFEEYVKKVLKIPYCNLDGFNPTIAYEIIVGLSLMYEMYPFFDRVICSIESMKDFRDHYNMLAFSNKKQFENSKCNYTDFEKEINNVNIIYLFAKAYCCDTFASRKINVNFAKKYFSLITFDKNKNVIIPNLEATNLGRLGIYHEFGHLLDWFLNISCNEKFLELIKGHNISKEVSNYATTNNEDLVAEAFARYIFYKRRLTTLEKSIGRTNFSNIKPKESQLVNEIGKLIDLEYQKFVKFRQIKFINQRYKFNKKYTIKKDFEVVNINQIEEDIKKSFKKVFYL